MVKFDRLAESEPADEALIASYLRGDMGAFDRLYRRHDRKTFAFVRQMLHPTDHATVEDLHQDGWLAAGWRKPYPVVYESAPQEIIVPGEPTLATATVIDPAFKQKLALMDRKGLLSKMGVSIRAAGEATVPTTIGLERATNPFLRARDADEFATLRAGKDNFKG